MYKRISANRSLNIVGTIFEVIDLTESNPHKIINRTKFNFFKILRLQSFDHFPLLPKRKDTQYLADIPLLFREEEGESEDHVLRGDGNGSDDDDRTRR